jgi:hypothetical protein
MRGEEVWLRATRPPARAAVAAEARNTAVWGEAATRLANAWPHAPPLPAPSTLLRYVYAVMPTVVIECLNRPLNSVLVAQRITLPQMTIQVAGCCGQLRQLASAVRACHVPASRGGQCATPWGTKTSESSQA